MTTIETQPSKFDDEVLVARRSGSEPVPEEQPFAGSLARNASPGLHHTFWQSGRGQVVNGLMVQHFVAGETIREEKYSRTYNLIAAMLRQASGCAIHSSRALGVGGGGTAALCTTTG